MSNAKNIASAIQKGSNVYVYDEKGISLEKQCVSV